MSASANQASFEDQDAPLLTAVQNAFDANRLAYAKRLCEHCTCEAPDDSDAYRYLGHAHLLLGEHARAINAATRATELAPHDARTWSDLGRLHALLGAAERAIPYFSKPSPSIHAAQTVGITWDWRTSNSATFSAPLTP